MNPSKAACVLLLVALAVNLQPTEATLLHGNYAFWLNLITGGKGVPPAPVAAPTTVAVPPTARPTTPPSPKAPAPPGGAARTFPNVAAVAIGTPQLSTLVEIASAVGLAETLADENLVATVLAPNNAAFQAFLSSARVTTDQLLANQDLVKLVLSYHLIPGSALTASELSNGQVLTTADQGQTLTVSKNGSDVFFVPNRQGAPRAKVVVADIQAGQAIVHIINQVLIPANFQLPGAGNTTANATATATATGAAATENVTGVTSSPATSIIGVSGEGITVTRPGTGETTINTNADGTEVMAGGENGIAGNGGDIGSGSGGDGGDGA